MLKPLLVAAGGAAAGFWIAKVRYEKAAYRYANERIEQAKAYAEERADRQIQKFQAETEVGAVAQVAKVLEKEQERIEEVLADPVIDKLITNYQGFSAPSMPNVVPEGGESHIILLKRQEFFNGPLTDTYDQVSVTYYPDEDILYEDMSHKQLDVQAAVGNIRLTWFGGDAIDENVCYVRNTKTEVEFEVVRSHGSFKADVLGIIDGEGKG